MLMADLSSCRSSLLLASCSDNCDNDAASLISRDFVAFLYDCLLCYMMITRGPEFTCIPSSGRRWVLHAYGAGQLRRFRAVVTLRIFDIGVSAAPITKLWKHRIATWLCTQNLGTAAGTEVEHRSQHLTRRTGRPSHRIWGGGG